MKKIPDIESDLVGKTQKIMYNFFIPQLEISLKNQEEILKALIKVLNFQCKECKRFHKKYCNKEECKFIKEINIIEKYKNKKWGDL